MRAILDKIARLPRRAFRQLGEAAGYEVREKVPPFSPFECLVLQGCRDLLSSGPKLAIELHVDLLRRYGSSLEEFLELIDADRCRGTMLPRSGPQTAVPFDPNSLPSSGIVNLFLEKKK